MKRLTPVRPLLYTILCGFFLLFPTMSKADDWLQTPHGFQIRAQHPRIATTPAKLAAIIERISGPSSRDPYKRWFELIKNKEDESGSVTLSNLALIYLVTGQQVYLDRVISRWPGSGDPSLEELYALDLLWDQLPDSVKLSTMARVSANDDCWYWNSVNQSNATDASWGYHSAIGVTRALAYAGIFALTDLEENKDPQVYRFNCLNYLGLVHEELSPTGYFYRIERRIAGDPTNNDALPGSLGGMYDNFGYDRGEESYSIHVLHEYENLTGSDRAAEFFHDRYRGTFYQNFQYPHRFTRYENDSWAHKAGTETHIQARIWYTRTDAYMPASHAVALTAARYQDGRMQDYAVNGIDVELMGYDYDLAFWYLMYFDDSLATNPPSTNPTAYYASGPGLVSMRSDWSNDAAFAVFVCGEGISRRYEDAGSFILHRKAEVIPIAGARIRNNYDNSKHHWYHIRSASKNTLKIFDPEEAQDRDYSNAGRRGPLHSGPKLVPSDNLGGQMFESAISDVNLQYNMSYGPTNNSQANGLSYREMGNIIKYEHIPDVYTYSVGDATEAYTKKIEHFQREFLYLRPDIFVIFDRVKSVDPAFRKVWTIHTVDEPFARGENSPQMGLKRASNSHELEINNPLNTTYIDSVFPEQNLVKIRGGDTVILQGAALSSSESIGEAEIRELDIPRWLELFAMGGDTEGEITITGEAQEGNVSETISFAKSTYQSYVTSSPTSKSATTLQDTTKNWQENQWAGYVLRTRSNNQSEDIVISGNNSNTLFLSESYTSDGVWGYYILRQVANSYNHWKKITSITTENMQVENLLISTPHYFDTEDAYGNLYSFSPHTDGRDDNYRKSKSIGQWTLEVEATTPKLADVFLHVISMQDPGTTRPGVEKIKGDKVSGAVIGERFVIFANEPGELQSLSANVPINGEAEGLVCNLSPSTLYSYTIKGGKLTVVKGNSGGKTAFTSPMGILNIGGKLAGKQGILQFLPAITGREE